MDGTRLFLVEHEHSDETCPSATREGMETMADLVMGEDHAARSGVEVREDYKVLDEHRLLLLVEAPDADHAEAFAEPFREIGTTRVKELGRCQAVLAARREELEGA